MWSQASDQKAAMKEQDRFKQRRPERKLQELCLVF